MSKTCFVVTITFPNGILNFRSLCAGKRAQKSCLLFNFPYSRRIFLPRTACLAAPVAPVSAIVYKLGLTDPMYARTELVGEYRWDGKICQFFSEEL